MDKDSSIGSGKRDLDDVVEQDPESKHGTEGQAAHGGDQAGPNSADAGRMQAPQKGDPHDRAH